MSEGNCETCGITPEEALHPSMKWHVRHHKASTPLCRGAAQAKRLYSARQRGDTVLCRFCCITETEAWRGGTRWQTLHDKWAVPVCEHARAAADKRGPRRPAGARVHEGVLGSTYNPGTGTVCYHDTLTRGELLAARGEL